MGSIRNKKIASRLLQWYDAHGRSLPWRKTLDPYKIFVSEGMLQQTQVLRVLLYYKAWLKQFPTWKALAKATNGQVLQAWAGLGYNRRALMLRDVAREIVARGAPTSEVTWRLLKGVGPYTAAAVTLFSGAEITVPIDTNVRRVWGRVLLGKPFPLPHLDAQIRAKLIALMRETKRAGDLIQATFDLATFICTKQPSCAICPLKQICPISKKFLSGTLRAPKRTTAISNERIHRNKKYPDRIYRGRILKVVRETPQGVSIGRIGSTVDPFFDTKHDHAWLRAMLKRLQRDGMVRFVRDKILLHE